MSGPDVQHNVTQAIFINSRAPDMDTLIAGVTPGEPAFVLDASRDGVQQIADIVAANDLANLAAISIVGHGAPGEIHLGSKWLDHAGLAGRAAALSRIGAALAPGGDLALYACNTAAGDTGRQFIAGLSHYAGGVDVAAATHPVGNAEHGGSWTLDASIGTIAASAPFTAATLTNFQGVLSGMPTIGALNGTTVKATQSTGGVILLATPPTEITDGDGDGILSGATVRISNFQPGDLLGLGTVFGYSNTPAEVRVVAGALFLISYDSATGVMTIANQGGSENTVAQYEALLAKVSFKVAGFDSSTGAHPIRTITWQVNDGLAGDPAGATNVTTTTVTVNRATVAVFDNTTTLAGAASAPGNVLANDSDRDGDTFTVSGFTGSHGAGALGVSYAGTYGHLTLNSDGSYVYIADNASAIAAVAPGSHAVETFLYSANDGTSNTTTQLAITIDRAPVAAADTNTASVGGAAATGNVLTANDTDADGDTLEITGFTAGGAGIVGSLFQGTYGNLILAADGAYSYQAGVSAAQRNAIASAGANPTEVITYTADDGHGGTASSTLSITVSVGPATVTSVTTSGPGIVAGNGDLTVGEAATFTINFDAAVTVAGGIPTLTLNNGAVATYSGGSGTTALTFVYTVAPSQDVGDLAVTAALLHGATITDAGGSNADLGAAAVNPAGTLQIDTTAPTVSSVATSGTGITAGNGDLNAGDTVTLTVNLSEAVTVTGGTPTLTLNDGGIATYSGGTGSTTLTFSYTVAAGQNTADLAVTAVTLNGATVKDGAGNAANLTAW